MLAADAKKAGSASEDTRLTPVLHWEAGLKPLYVRDVRVWDALDGRSKSESNNNNYCYCYERGE